MADEKALLPIRTTVTVLPADPPAEPIGFVMYERNGTEVHKANAPDVLLTSQEDLSPGEEVIVYGLFGPVFMTVARDDYGVLYAKSDHLVATLHFADDDRR